MTFRLLSLCVILGLAAYVSGCGSDTEPSVRQEQVDSGPMSGDMGSLADVMVSDDVGSHTNDSGIGGTGGAGGAGGTDGGGGAGGQPECPTDEQFLSDVVWPDVLERSCFGCHQESGLASETRLILRAPQEPGAPQENLATLREVSQAELNGESLLLLKALGRHPDGHDSDVDIDPESTAYATLESLAGRLRGDLDECGLAIEDVADLVPLGECESLTPGPRVLRRLSHLEYENTIADLFGIEVDAKAAFVADPVEYGFDNHPELLHVQGLLAEQYRRMAESISKDVDVEALLPCSLAEADIRCGHSFISGFGKRAYRRPLTTSEIRVYRELFSSIVAEECFEQAVRWIVAAVLQSPHFLYRTELGRRTEDGFVLTSYEIATELSYLIWQTMPDEELFDAAADGRLLNPLELRRQTARLIHSPRSTAMVRDFAGKWLGTQNLMHVVRDAVIYAALDLDLRQSMLEENHRFVADLWSRDRPYTDLFLARSSWLNTDLATHYGIAFGEESDDPQAFRRVPLDETRPGGVLTQGAFLTTHASPTSSSPIMRGLLVRERLLCEELSLPAFAIPELPADAGPNATTRERFAAHTENEVCQSCHTLIDPLGFGFEHYDGIGRYREMDGAMAVDATGSIVRPGGQDTPFNGVGELAGFLAEDPQVQACFARQWIRFGFGESEFFDADCHVGTLTDHLAGRGGRLKSVLAALTRLPHFRTRSGEEREQDVIGANLIPAAEGQAPEMPDPAPPPDGLENPVCGEEPVMEESAEVGDPRLQLSAREDRWEDGYCQYLTVTNIGQERLNGWAVEIEVEGEVNNAWSVMRDGDSGTVVFRNVVDNAVLDPRQQAQFGFCAAI